jgi:hypothetical protein
LAVALLGSQWEMNMNSVAMHDLKKTQTIETEGYRVEVSGWDADECFFVEKSRLVWTESAGKRVALHALVRIGSVLFVRLIQPMGAGSSFPVPYRAVEFQSSNHDAEAMVILEQLQPRVGFREMTSDSIPAGHLLA